MNGEEMVSRSMSPSHDDSRKETETTALPPPPLSDENERHAQHILRRRPRSLTWKGFNPFHFGHIDREPPPQGATAVNNDEEGLSQDWEAQKPATLDHHIFPRSKGLLPFSSGPKISGYLSEEGSRSFFSPVSNCAWKSKTSSEDKFRLSSSDGFPGSNLAKTAPAGSLPLEGLAYRKASSRGGNSEVIYATDIDMAHREGMPQMSATDIVVQRHRRRVRVKVKSTNKQYKQRKGKRRATIARRVRLGKPLDPEDDEAEYILAMGMMLGLRVAVGRQGNPLEGKELISKDFYQVDKYVFPPRGSMGILSTPSHKLGRTFKFKDYSPRVFRHIREHFGVDRVDYILSVAGNYTFLEFISNAKSGEFFFFSHDEKFMIKTMKSSEVKFLRRILPHYYKHVKLNPQTLLVRYFGMYRVKIYHLRRKVVHFVVMNSVLDTHKVIHETFDIKGSTLGRYAKPGEKVKKDMDLVNRDSKIALGPYREPFLKIIEADVNFLASMNVMDYSLLLGIHDRLRPREEDEPFTGKRVSPRRVSRFFNFVDEREGEDATKWQGEGDIDGHPHNLAQNLAACDVWDDSTGEYITGDEDDVESIPPHSATLGSVDSLNNYPHDNKDWCEVESPDVVYNYEPETQHPAEYGSIELPACIVTEETAKAVEAVEKSKAAEGGKPEGGGEEQEAIDQKPSSSKLLVFLPRRKDLGIQSMNKAGLKGSEIYFMGIIDMLQVYNTRKSAEHSFKALRHFKSDMSCVDPIYYSQRFLSFLKAHTE